MQALVAVGSSDGPPQVGRKQTRVEELDAEEINETRRATLREQATRAANKKLKTIAKNTELTKAKRAKI